MTKGRFVVAAALILGSWVVGRSQSVKSDFVIAIESPNGAKLVCLKGCDLVGGRDVGNRTPQRDYSYRCGGQNSSEPCLAEVHGFIRR
jgi:hypothetical protein